MTGKSIAQCCALAAALALLAYAPARAASDSWQPIDPADLAMKSEPLAPGASAIYLYREVEVDDTQGYTDYYYRVKILTDAGKDAATVHIPQITFGELSETVSNVRGRTIHPDGTIIPWQGQIIQQSVARARGIKEMAKTFSLPDVQTGSIIEYRFRIGWDRTWLFETEFVANADLFTRQLHCTLKRYEEDYYLAWQTEHMPGNQVPVQDNHDLLWHFDAQNLPGIQDEEFMPPKEAIEGKVIFYYTDQKFKDANAYWTNVGKGWNDPVEHFVGHNSAIRDEANRVAPASDPPETRLRKLYARTQQIRNLSAGTGKTEQEIKAEKLKDNKSAEDVLKNGYGYGSDINLFFIALARAAGFDASQVQIANRDMYFFNPAILDDAQLRYAEVTMVKLNGQNLFLDPATPHAGFGQLPWEETDVQGIALDNKGGTFVTTTPPQSSDAVVERTATLKLGDDGWLQGKLAVTFIGQEALLRRLTADSQDDADRKKDLTDKVSAWLPAGATLTLTNEPDWKGSDDPLRAEFDVRMRPMGASSGHMALLSESFFSDADLPQFQHPERTYALYFAYPWEVHDDVTLTLPLTLQAGDLPTPINRPSGFGVYQLSCTKQPGALHFQRSVTLHGFYYDMQYYGQIRNYFDEARNADKQQVILRFSGTPAAQIH